MPDPTRPPSLLARPLVARLAYLFGAAAIVVAIVLTRAPGTAASPGPLDIHTTSAGVQVDPPQITVTGVGDVYGTPDTLNVQMDVSSQASHASAALSQNESETSSLIQTLTGAGVSQSDIQTASLSIEPVYGSDGDQITGYEVDETVAVTLRDLSTAGSVLDAAARSVGDDIRVESMSLSISDTSSLMAQARAEAMTDAKTRASQLASGAGASLGAIVSVTDNTQTSTAPPISYGESVPAASPAVPVQAGSEQLSVSVTVVYQLGS
ncbi:MAG: SIMPL domain-containing protein [Candidatus Dormibacteria bacterium]|jgi:uncharacterized protein YggE